MSTRVTFYQKMIAVTQPTEQVEVPMFPDWLVPAPHYVGVFNKVAVELNLPVAWNPRESAPTLTSAAEPGVSLKDMTSLVQTTIETRRRQLAKGAHDQVTYRKSCSIDAYEKLRPVEKTWIDQVMPELCRYVEKIYGGQLHHDFERLEAWMERHADPYSRAYFRKTKSWTLPPIRPDFRPEGISNYSEHVKDYASAIPWFPKTNAPTARFNAMWPAGFTQEEYAFFTAHLPATDPIFSPQTVVDRIGSDEVARIKAAPMKNRHGKQVEWGVTGLEGQAYRVTHISFHERFATYFQKIADVLLQFKDIELDGETLHEDFRHYLLIAAEFLQDGDVEGLLNADLDQAEGPLFLTLFQHEGYGDQVKFPLFLELIIRDQELTQAAKAHLWGVQALEEEVIKIASRLGLQLESTSLPLVEVGYLYRAAGLIQSLLALPAGHDYPKINYPGVKRHRNIILADVPIAGMMEEGPDLRKEIFSPQDTLKIQIKQALLFLLFHEVAHGLQGNKIDSATTIGKKLGDAFREYTNALIEPLSDVASLYAQSLLEAAHQISLETLESGLTTEVWGQFRLFPGKEEALSSDAMQRAPHGVGKTLILGYMFASGGLSWENPQEPTNPVTIHHEVYRKSLKDLFVILTTFALTGDQSGYLAFVKQCIENVPALVAERIKATKQALKTRPYLIDRGDLTSFKVE